jgi:hypothetical protein
VVQQIHKVVQLPRLGLVHPRRCSHQARAQVACGLDHWQGSDSCLEAQEQSANPYLMRLRGIIEADGGAWMSCGWVKKALSSHPCRCTSWSTNRKKKNSEWLTLCGPCIKTAVEPCDNSHQTRPLHPCIEEPSIPVAMAVLLTGASSQSVPRVVAVWLAKDWGAAAPPPLFDANRMNCMGRALNDQRPGPGCFPRPWEVVGKQNRSTRPCIIWPLELIRASHG